jgi:hypothetical protein
MTNREETSIGIFEQDTNDDILCVWTFPGFISSLMISYLLLRNLCPNPIFVH